MKNILILSSNPRNDLKLEREIKDLQNIIKRSKNQSQFDIEFKPEVRPEELQDLFLEHEPQIVHFCGYGTGVRGLMLQNSAGEEQLVTIDALSNLFQLFANSCECVLLDGCYSEIQANAIAKYINYTIGISYETRDDAGIPQKFAQRCAFTTGFYRALGWGKSIEESYQFGCNAIQIQMPKAINSLSNKSKASQQMLAVDVAEPIIISEDLKPVLKKKQLLTSFTESATSALSGNDPDLSTTPDLSSQLMAALEVEEGYKQYRELTRETWDEFGQTSFVAREPISKNEYRQRTTLLSKVKKIWIEDFLNKPSLYGNAAINLNWKNSLQSVKLPFEAIELDESFEELQTTDILNQTGQGKTLLILGEPGSGKTIALLQLTERLVTEIEQDLTKPIPVVFNLSSWGQKQQPIENWLIEELKDKYQVPQRCSEPWLKQQQLILLLDGLDEVRADRRDACVRALNQFITAHNLTEMVVCSRIKDYEALTERLQLSSAICIKPLSSEQVSSFLTKAGDSLAGLKTLLQSDRELAQFAQTPLILNIMSMAYRGWSTEQLLQQFQNSEDRYRHLFDSYIERMLRRRVRRQLEQNPATKYPQEKVLHWLSWLAKQLSETSQTVFLIEKIQPTWLPKDYQKLLYAIGVGWTVGLTAAVFHVVPLSRVFGGDEFLVKGLIGGVIAGLLYGLLGGFISRWLSGMMARLAMGLTLGLLFGLAFGLVINPKFELAFELVINRTFGITYGLLYTVCGFIIYEFFREDIKLVDTLKWSWQKALKNLWLALIFGFILWFTNKAFGVIFGLLLWLILGGEKQTKISKTTRPNQGIWKSVRNTINVAVITGLGSGIFTGVIHYLVIHSEISIMAIPSNLFDSIPITKNSLVFGLLNGIMFGYAAALLSTQGAGFVGLKHLMLRLLLWRSDRIPWNYARFLDYASERLLMKKVGGGYVFYHRMLMEHFARRDRVSGEPVPVTPQETLQPVALAGTRTTEISSNLENTVSRSSASYSAVRDFIICRNCDRRNPTDGKFCSNCGEKLNKRERRPEF